MILVSLVSSLVAFLKTFGQIFKDSEQFRINGMPNRMFCFMHKTIGKSLYFHHSRSGLDNDRLWYSGRPACSLQTASMLLSTVSIRWRGTGHRIVPLVWLVSERAAGLLTAGLVSSGSSSISSSSCVCAVCSVTSSSTAACTGSSEDGYKSQHWIKRRYCSRPISTQHNHALRYVKLCNDSSIQQR